MLLPFLNLHNEYKGLISHLSAISTFDYSLVFYKGVFPNANNQLYRISGGKEYKGCFVKL